MDKKALIEGIRKYAEANYDNGWDVVVEAMTDEEVFERIDGTNTLQEAIKVLQWGITLCHENRNEHPLFDETLQHILGSKS